MVGGSSFHSYPTLCNEYANEEKEYIFCIKGRPFGCLVSPHIPTPTSTLVDYNLVRDIGMKMTDLQYTKFSFCGQKLRILGKISITVQTIHDGLASGSFHLKANVILDLSKNLRHNTTETAPAASFVSSHSLLSCHLCLISSVNTQPS